jgi:hypothetical protein
MPPKKVGDVPVTAVSQVREPSLVDLPYQYLVDKSQWSDFKRHLNN